MKQKGDHKRIHDARIHSSLRSLSDLSWIEVLLHDWVHPDLHFIVLDPFFTSLPQFLVIVSHKYRVRGRYFRKKLLAIDIDPHGPKEEVRSWKKKYRQNLLHFFLASFGQGVRA